MLARLISSSSAAALVTSGLLLLMAGLIAQQRAPILTDPPVFEVPMLTFTTDPPEVHRRTPPQKPSDPLDPPKRTPIDHTGPSILVAGGNRGHLEPPVRFVNLPQGIADGDLMTLVAVAPTYPAAAERRRLEGFVIVEFTVTANGSVTDIRVSESTHSVFERAAIDAASKFRFRPRVVDGTPIVVEGVRRRITFKLQD